MLKPGEPKANLTGLSPAMRDALVRLLKGPMYQGAAGYLGSGEYLNGVSAGTMLALDHRGLVIVTRARHPKSGGTVKRASLTPSSGDWYARTVAMEEAEQRVIQAAPEKYARQGAFRARESGHG